MTNQSRKQFARRAKIAASAWKDRLLTWEALLVWQLMCRAAKPVRPAEAAIRRVVVLPSDPYTLIGAKGDEAMMCAALDQLRSKDSALTAWAITASSEAERCASKLGLTPLPIWRRGPLGVLRGLLNVQPDLLLVVGADVMDGYYSPRDAVRRLALADLAARHGVRTTVLGFSFNRAPAAELRPLLDGLSPNLKLNLRDAVSRERFRLASKHPTQLVSDVAFLLRPDAGTGRVAAFRAWVTAQKERGAVVLGFNVHPHLVAGGGREQVSALVHAAVDALRSLMARHHVSVALIAHDFRDGAADGICLESVQAGLNDAFPQRVFRAADEFSAAELKAMAGELDGVITGRMHLAIAALGMGVPVAALTYQDKFQGLFRHFELPESLLLSPAEAMQSSALLALCESFLERLPQLRVQVAASLPAVLAASRLNLSELSAPLSTDELNTPLYAGLLGA
jgi:colanic acid/amylovoran biosynthesis protein